MLHLALCIVALATGYVKATVLCCNEKIVGDVTYKLVDIGDTTQFNCKAACIYEKKGSPGSRFCFKEGGPLPVVCVEDGASGLNSTTAIGLRNKFEKITETFANKYFSSYDDKIIWIDEQLENIMGKFKNDTSTTQFIDILLLPVSQQSSKSIWEMTNKILGLFQTSADVSKFNEELDTLEGQSITVDEKQGIQAARFASNFISGGATKYIKSMMAQTDWSDRDVNISSCKQTIVEGGVGGAIAACAANPESCEQSALDAAYKGMQIGMLDCVPKSDICIIICFCICFSTSSQVETINGFKGINELVIGDFVRTSSGGNETHFTEFLGWISRTKTARVSMVEIVTSHEHSSLILTGNHIVFTSTSSKMASDILPGDKLLHWNGFQMEELDVMEVIPTISNGSWAPLTRDGTLFVDGILSSCYSSGSHEVLDLAMFPLKADAAHLLDNEISQHDDGVRFAARELYEELSPGKITENVCQSLF